MRPDFGKMLCRWRPRFGLRTMLVAIAILCAVLANEVRVWHADVVALRLLMEHKHASAIVSSFGLFHCEVSDTEQLWPLRNVTWIRVGCLDLTERPLSEFPRLRGVTVSGLRTNPAHWELATNLQRRHPDLDVGVMFWGAFRRDPFADAEEQARLEVAIREFQILKGWSLD